MSRTTPRHMLLSPRVITISVSLFLCLLVRVPPLQADVILDIYQSGTSVVATYAGTIDTTDLTFDGIDEFGGAPEGNIYASLAQFTSIPTELNDLYSGLSGPTAWGAGSAVGASTVSGDDFGVVGSSGHLWVPTGYVSGGSINGTATWDSNTLTSLGLTDGTYTYTWGTGAYADELVVNIGAPVPEPASITLLLTVLAAVALVAGRKRLT
jgi:hypothetical protein